MPSCHIQFMHALSTFHSVLKANMLISHTQFNAEIVVVNERKKCLKNHVEATQKMKDP
jgi:hypothetical protein